MAISGGIKFFKQSKIIDATASAPISGNASVSALLNGNHETFYRSVSSSDVVTEEITITSAEPKTIDRLFIRDTNLKDFNVMYDVSGTWTHFASVLDIDASRANITRTDFSEDTYYAEFTSVTTSAIRIQATKTQVANAQKFINQAIVTEELSTMVGYPEIKSIILDRGSRVKKTISNKYSVQKSLEGKAYKIAMKRYPSVSTYNVDIDAVLDLHDSEDPFLVWLCGGRFGPTFFRYTLRGFRLKDIIQMQVRRSINLSYLDNIYVSSSNLASLDLVEHI